MKRAISWVFIVLVAIAISTYWLNRPRPSVTVSLQQLRDHPEAYLGRTVIVQGRVEWDESGPVGGKYISVPDQIYQFFPSMDYRGIPLKKEEYADSFKLFDPSIPFPDPNIRLKYDVLTSPAIWKKGVWVRFIQPDNRDDPSLDPPDNAVIECIGRWEKNEMGDFQISEPRFTILDARHALREK